MPIYEYRCEDCGHEFEALVRSSDTPACEKCASPKLARLLSLPAIKSETTSELAMRAAHKRDRKSTRLNSSHIPLSRMPSSA